MNHPRVQAMRTAQGLSPSQLAGWIGLADPYGFLPSANPDVQPVFHHPDYPHGAQPIEHVSKLAPRMRVNHLTLAAAFGRPLRGLAPVLQDVADFVHDVTGT